MLPHLVDLDDVGVPQGRDRTRTLLAEPLDLLGLGAVVAPDHLQRDQAVGPTLEGQVDDAHAAPAEDPADLVVRDLPGVRRPAATGPRPRCRASRWPISCRGAAGGSGRSAPGRSSASRIAAANGSRGGIRPARAGGVVSACSSSPPAPAPARRTGPLPGRAGGAELHRARRRSKTWPHDEYRDRSPSWIGAPRDRSLPPGKANLARGNATAGDFTGPGPGTGRGSRRRPPPGQSTVRDTSSRSRSR